MLCSRVFARVRYACDELRDLYHQEYRIPEAVHEDGRTGIQHTGAGTPQIEATDGRDERHTIIHQQPHHIRRQQFRDQEVEVSDRSKNTTRRESMFGKKERDLCKDL